MNIDELEKLARAAHDPDFPWIDRDAMIGGLFAKGEIDYIAAATPADILELIENYRKSIVLISEARLLVEDDNWITRAVRQCNVFEVKRKAKKARWFKDALMEDRCLWNVTLKDGSNAQCGRKHINGQLCSQHKKMADKWECNFCGGNDEFPIHHCMDCARANGESNE